MTIRESQLINRLTNECLDRDTRKELQTALRGLKNSEFYTEIKDIERGVAL